jgi:hypothetical protein
LLRAGHADYVVDAEALAYMRERAPAGPLIERLANQSARHFPDQAMQNPRPFSARFIASFFATGLLLLVILGAVTNIIRKQNTGSNAAAAGPLRVNPANPRYFTDGTGKAVYLTGSHTWTNLQDRNGVISDYTAYLAFMRQRHHTFMRMWMNENGINTDTHDPMPWARDSSGKYNLTQLNQAYFDRMRSRIIEAGNKGIYVSVMLFNGWSLYDHSYGNPWPVHPFNINNNVNNINGDPNNDNSGAETHTLALPEILAIQRDYVHKVIDTVNDLDNVLYEIANEDTPASYDWQYEMIHAIKDYEAAKPKQHPVGMTSIEPWSSPSNTKLLDSPADWISPATAGGMNYESDPTAADGRKVIIVDTDHVFGMGGNRDWIWKNFLRGNNPIFMDDEVDNWSGSERNDARIAMGYTASYAQRMNLNAMAPQGNLSSTSYALANSGAEYLIYQPAAGAFTVTLAPGTYEVEWFNPATGQPQSAGTVNGPGDQSFTPPFTGDAVLYLKSSRNH